MFARRRRSIEGGGPRARQSALATNAELARETARLRAALARSHRERNETDRALLKARQAAVPATRVDAATQTEDLRPLPLQTKTEPPSRDSRKRRMAAPAPGVLGEPSRKTKMRRPRGA